MTPQEYRQYLINQRLRELVTPVVPKVVKSNLSQQQQDQINSTITLATDRMMQGLLRYKAAVKGDNLEAAKSALIEVITQSRVLEFYGFRPQVKEAGYPAVKASKTYNLSPGPLLVNPKLDVDKEENIG